MADLDVRVEEGEDGRAGGADAAHAAADEALAASVAQQTHFALAAAEGGVQVVVERGAQMRKGGPVVDENDLLEERGRSALENAVHGAQEGRPCLRGGGWTIKFDFSTIDYDYTSL